MVATSLKPISFLFNLVIFLVTTSQTCELSQCGPNIQIQHPFSFKFTDQDQRCEHTRFQILSCNNNNDTIVSLPSAGNFSVKKINYQTRTISVNDPKHCLPGKLIGNFTVDSPFRVRYDPHSFTFLNCTKNTSRSRDSLFPIYCLSGEGYTIFAARTGGYDDKVLLSCGVVSVVLVPMRGCRGYGFGLYEDVNVRWDSSCDGCGGVCIGDECIHSPPTPLLPYTYHPPANERNDASDHSALYSVLIVIVLVIIIMSLRCYCCKTGVPRETIESYPTTRLDGLWQLPVPDPNCTCSICHLGYHVGQTIRTIPNCSHFFHVQCVEEWLLRDNTCPVCRIRITIPNTSS